MRAPDATLRSLRRRFRLSVGLSRLPDRPRAMVSRKPLALWASRRVRCASSRVPNRSRRTRCLSRGKGRAPDEVGDERVTLREGRLRLRTASLRMRGASRGNHGASRGTGSASGGTGSASGGTGRACLPSRRASRRSIGTSPPARRGAIPTTEGASPFVSCTAPKRPGIASKGSRGATKEPGTAPRS